MVVESPSLNCFRGYNDLFSIFASCKGCQLFSSSLNPSDSGPLLLLRWWWWWWSWLVSCSCYVHCIFNTEVGKVLIIFILFYYFWFCFSKFWLQSGPVSWLCLFSWPALCPKPIVSLTCVCATLSLSPPYLRIYACVCTTKVSHAHSHTTFSASTLNILYIWQFHGSIAKSSPLFDCYVYIQFYRILLTFYFDFDVILTYLTLKNMQYRLRYYNVRSSLYM